MRTSTTLAAYAAALAVVFGAAAGVGQAVGPVVDPAPAGAHGGQHGSAHGSAQQDEAAPAVAGLSVTSDGHTLVLDEVPQAAGRPGTLAFRVLGPDGEPVTQYAVEHERELHLVVVRRDAAGFQHLHPERDAAGRWSTPLVLPTGGTYKVFADTRPAGLDEGLVLAADVTVPGPLAVTARPGEQRTAVVDGYAVTLQGDLAAGTRSPLVLRVTRGGRPVTDLQPYLGAYGHLVALREGDLAYLHVHPEGPAPDGATGGPEVRFDAEVPTAGRYRLFLDFQHEGVVRTAAFATSTGTAAARGGTAPAPHDDGTTHGH